MKYKVYITRHESGMCIVEAKDKEEAEYLADEYLEDHYDELFEPGNAVYSFETEEYKGDEQ